MKRLRRVSAEIRALYYEMGETFATYQRELGLPCPSGCGGCCLAPTIEASPHEMLPMALTLFDRGLAEETLSALSEAPSLQCIHYKKTSFDGTKGYCQQYETRPTLCRVFGVAGRLNKARERELSVCKVIKSKYGAVTANLGPLERSNAPLMGQWKGEAASIDGPLSKSDLPINEALRISLEKVLLTSQYSPDDNSPEDSNVAM